MPIFARRRRSAAPLRGGVGRQGEAGERRAGARDLASRAKCRTTSSDYAASARVMASAGRARSPPRPGTGGRSAGRAPARRPRCRSTRAAPGRRRPRRAEPPSATSARPSCATSRRSKPTDAERARADPDGGLAEPGAQPGRACAAGGWSAAARRGTHRRGGASRPARTTSCCCGASQPPRLPGDDGDGGRSGQAEHEQDQGETAHAGSDRRHVARRLSRLRHL